MRRVLVIENHRLLGAGIERLLRRECDLHVVGVTPEDDGAMLQALELARPDVVVVDAATLHSAQLLTLLEHYPGLRVLVVSADVSLVRTYDTSQVSVTEATELVDLVRS
jgi:DNA-binding NarL/FixJ family response regulator